MIGFQKIILKTLEPKNGNGYIEKSAKAVYAKIAQVGITTMYAAESVGKKVNLIAYVWRCDYNNETHAVYNGQTYKIDNAANFNNDTQIKLILYRG